MSGGAYLFGGTDLTVAVGQMLLEADIRVDGVSYVGERFDISYSPGGIANARAADLASWCAEAGIPAHPYAGVDALLPLVAGSGACVGLAAGWYHMIPRRVRELFPRGCLGVHASLLPRLRGGAPLNWALLTGERETGVTLFELADGIDDGPVYGRRSFAIGERATIGDLVAAAEAATLELVSAYLPGILAGTASPTSQTGAPTYALQRAPEDGRIDWTRSAREIDALVRAVGHPYPGARTALDAREIILWATELRPDAPPVHGAPGQIALLPHDDEPNVVTGEGLLAVLDATDVHGVSVVDELRRSSNRRLERF